MEFDNSFDVPLAPAEAWAVLMDIRRIAPCMPGAALTEIIDPQNFRGKIAVRLGPVALAFAGRVAVREYRRGQSQRPSEGAGQRRQRPRLGQRHGDVSHRAFGYRLARSDPHRSDAVGRGRAIRPRRRHDPGDRVADHRPVRGQPAQATRRPAPAAAARRRQRRDCASRSRRRRSRASAARADACASARCCAAAAT